MATLDSGEVLEQLVHLIVDDPEKPWETKYELTRDGERLADCIWEYLKKKETAYER